MENVLKGRGFIDHHLDYDDSVDGAPSGIDVPRWSLSHPIRGKPSTGRSISNFSSVTTIGLDIAKNVFQVHGAAA